MFEKKKTTLFLKVRKFTGEDKDISLCGCLFLRQKAQTIFVSENSFSINKNQY